MVLLQWCSVVVFSHGGTGTLSGCIVTLVTVPTPFFDTEFICFASVGLGRMPPPSSIAELNLPVIEASDCHSDLHTSATSWHHHNHECCLRAPPQPRVPPQGTKQPPCNCATSGAPQWPPRYATSGHHDYHHIEPPQGIMTTTTLSHLRTP